jgi:autophagy-related protein 9
MFRVKAQNFAMEVLALILSPYILCVSLAKCAEPICEFVLAIRAQVAGAGDICGFATFDFDVYCDESWSGRTLGNRNPVPLTGTLTESIMQTGNVDDAVKAYPTPMAKNGKMEQSFFSFRVRDKVVLMLLPVVWSHGRN